MRRCFTPSASGAQLAMTREGKIRALQDADRTRGDRDRVIFAAALVADYLAVSWTPAFLEPLARRHKHTHTHMLPGTFRSHTYVRHAGNLTSGLFWKGLVD